MEDYRTTARFLFESGLTITEYKALQDWRRKRLDLWLERKIKYLSEKEMELINHGDQVLIELEKLYQVK